MFLESGNESAVCVTGRESRDQPGNCLLFRKNSASWVYVNNTDKTSYEGACSP